MAGRRAPRQLPRPSLTQVSAVAVVVALVLASVVTLSPARAERDLPVFDARTTFPDHVDGVPLDEAPARTVVQVDPVALVTGEDAATGATVDAGGPLSDRRTIDTDRLRDTDRELLDRAGVVTTSPSESSDAVDGDGPGARGIAEAEVIAALEVLLDPEQVTPLREDRYALVGVEVDQVAGLPGVRSAEVDHLAMLFGDPFVEHQWHLENTGQQVANLGSGTAGMDLDWQRISGTDTGAGVVVAVVDTTIDTTHPDLAGRIWTNPGEVCGSSVDHDGNGHAGDCQGWNFATDTGDIHDTGAAAHHSTHVSTTIAGARNDVGIVGVAPDATIMPLVVSIDGEGFPMSRVAQAIDYAVDNGADVINLSLGSPPGTPRPSAEAAAIGRAEAAGVLVIAAAGNDAVDIDAQPVWPASSPESNVLTVGAIDHHGARSPFSNWGETAVDVAAPGSAVLAGTAGGWYGWMDGTSMAAPQAAGVAALYLARHPGAAPSELIAAVREASVDLASWQGRSVTGGMLSTAVTLGLGPAETAVTFSGLGTWPAGPTEVTTEVRVAGPEPAAVDVTLAMWWEGAAYAVTDHPVAVTIDGVAREAATDGEGRLAAVSDVTEVAELTLTTDLPDGEYVWVVERTGAEDGVRLGAFSVGTVEAVAPDAPPDAPSTGDGDDGGSGGTGEQPVTDGGDGGGTVPATPDGTDDGGATAPDDGSSTPPATDDGTDTGGTGPGGTEPDGSEPDATDPGPSDPGGDGPADDGTTVPAPDAGGDSPATGDPVPPADDTAPPADDGPTAGEDDATAPAPDDTPPPSGDDTTSPQEPSPDEDTTAPPPAAEDPVAWDGDGMVLPSSGRAGDLISVRGVFPDTARVRLGENPARVTAHSAFSVQVEVPHASATGAVDVVVRSVGGEVLAHYLDAFTYTHASAPTAPDDGSSGDGGGDGATPDDGGTAPVDDGGATSPDDGGGGTPPDDGGGTAPDSGGTSPVDGGGTAPDGDDGTAPEADATSPADGGGTTPDDGSGGTEPDGDDGTAPDDGGDTPRSGDSTPPAEDTTAPAPAPRTLGGVVTASNGLQVIQLGSGHPAGGITADLWPATCTLACTGRSV